MSLTYKQSSSGIRILILVQLLIRLERSETVPAGALRMGVRLGGWIWELAQPLWKLVAIGSLHNMN